MLVQDDMSAVGSNWAIEDCAKFLGKFLTGVRRTYTLAACAQIIQFNTDYILVSQIHILAVGLSTSYRQNK
jgi:hypothetical protein